MKYSSQTDYWVDPVTGGHRNDFDEMYRDFNDPWGCRQGVGSLSNHLFLELIFLSSQNEFNSFLDLGCGLGHLTNQINRRNNSKGGGAGCDISSIAIKKAKKEYPDIHFFEFNILDDHLETNQKYELLVLSEVFWYLSHQLSLVLEKMYSMIISYGHLAIQQYFPKDQKYFSTELSSDLELIKVLKQFGFQLNCHITMHDLDGEVMLAIFSKK